MAATKKSAAAAAAAAGQQLAKKPQSCIRAYQDLDNVDAPTCLCRDPTHSSQKLIIDADGKTVVGNGGYRQVKANHGVTEGRWYFEARIKHLKNQGNARIGWATIAGDLQAPCGYDQWSYSFRASPGNLFHNSRSQPLPSPDYVEGYREGDIVGVMIYLPRPSPEEIKTLEKRRWVAPEEYKQIDVPLPLPTAGSASEIRYFRNGKALSGYNTGTPPAFSDLHLGKYYPAVSLFREACVEVNFGPEFAYPPSTLCREGMPAGGARIKAAAVADDVKAGALRLMHDDGACYPFVYVRHIAPCVSLETMGGAGAGAGGPALLLGTPDKGPLSPHSMTAPPSRPEITSPLRSATQGPVPPPPLRSAE